MICCVMSKRNKPDSFAKIMIFRYLHKTNGRKLIKSIEKKQKTLQISGSFGKKT